MRKRPLIPVCGVNLDVRGNLLRIANVDGDKYTFPEDPEALIAAAKKCRTRIDLLTFLERVPNTKPRFSYPMELDNLAALPVSTFDHWWNKQLRSLPRNRARQAEKKGVTFREVPFGDELLKGVLNVYNETPFRQGKQFPYYGMNMEQVHAYAGTFLERSTYVGAFLDGEMIGFIKIVVNDTKTHACLVHILSQAKHRDKAPTNALIAQAVKFCAERGISYLVYENFNYGDKVGDSLSHFKEVNGFERMDLPRYYVPLTPMGKLAFRLRLHHKATEHLPEPVLTKLRELRRQWYGRKFQAASEA